MKLYNNTTNKPENIKFISNESGTYYVDKLSDAELIAFGYFQIVPEIIVMDYENFNYEETYNVVGDVCVQSYISTPREIEIPQSITIRQAREATIISGQFATIESSIAAIVDENERLIVRNYWEYSESFERTHPILIQMATGIMGMTDVDIDNFFIMAGKL